MIKEEKLLEENSKTGVLSVNATANVKCVMNKLNIFKENELYASYTCNTCPGKPTNICYLCYENCHKNHNNNTKNVNLRKLEIKKEQCSCALNDHVVTRQEIPIGAIRTGNQELQCTLNEILHYSNLTYYYMDPTTNMYYCMYCLEFCACIFAEGIEDPLSVFIKKERTKFGQNAPLCSCSNKDAHFPFYENLTSLMRLLITPSFDKFLNRIQIPGQILTKTSFTEKYLDPIKITHEEIFLNYKNNNLEKYQSTPLTKIYLNSLELLKSFAGAYGKDVHLITNRSVQNYYNYDFLFLIFSKSDDHLLIQTKINCLVFFRKFYILPLIKNKRWHNAYTDFENISPIHRILFRLSLREFFDLIQIDRNNFFKLLNRLHSMIFKYIDKVEEKEISSLIIEYFKYLILLISCKFIDDEWKDLNNSYYDLINKFVQIIQLVYNKKGFENSIKKYIEIFILKVYLTNNDNLFFYKIPVNSNKSKKSKSSTAKKKNYVELDEDEDDLEPELDNELYKPKNFCFQKGDLELQLIKTLFAFNKEETDLSKEIKVSEIYDLLVNKYDFYQENIDCLYDSELVSKNYIDKDITNYFNSIDNLSMEKILSPEEMTILNLIIEDFKILEDTKIRYYDSSITENILYGICLKSLESLKKNFTAFKFWGLESLSNFTVKIEVKVTDIKKSIQKQIYLFKYGLMDILLNMYNIFNLNVFLKLKLGKDKINILNKFIIDNFKLLTVKNSFLTVVFFNPHIMNFFFPTRPNNQNDLYFLKNNFDYEYELLIKDFYLHLLKLLLEQNYKISTLKFVEIFIKEFDVIFSLRSQLNTNELLTLLNIILKCLRKCLLVTNNKLSSKVNNLIATKVKEIISIESETDLTNLFYEKFDDYSAKLDKVDVITKKFVFGSYKIVNNLEDNYFILISNHLNLEDIKTTLERINEIDPKVRRVLTKTFSRFIVECPFKILSNVGKKEFELMNSNIDINLVGKFTETIDQVGKPAEVIKAELNKIHPSSDTVVKSTADLRKGIIRKPSSIKISGERDENQSVVSRSVLRGFVGNKKNKIHNTFNLDVLIYNMETYRRVIKKHFQYFMGNPKFYIKYFTDVILIPCVFTVYKLLYFSKQLTAKFKYLTYKCVFLFLECFKTFLNGIINESYKLLYTEENEEEFLKYLKREKPKQDIRELLYSIIEVITSDIALFALSEFEPLKLAVVMDKFIKYISKFYVVNFLTGEKSSSGDLIVPKDNKTNDKNKKTNKDSIQSVLKEFIEEYTTLKENIEENVLIDFFTTNTEEDVRSKEIKKTIALDLLFRIDSGTSYGKSSLSAKTAETNINKDQEEEKIISVPICKFNEENTLILETVNKLFKSNPDFWQEMIVTTCSIMKKHLYGLIQDQLIFLCQFIFIEFHKLSRNSSTGANKFKYSSAVENAIHVIEFLRLHCENHNKIFQTLLINIYMVYSEIDLIDFMLKLPVLSIINLEYYKNKKDIIQYFKPIETLYFNKLQLLMTDYLIEIIQGSFASNFKKIVNSSEFVNFYEISYRFFDSVEEHNEYEIYLAHFMRFVTCFLDENTNTASNKLILIKKFNPQKMLVALMHGFKKLYFNQFKEKINCNFTNFTVSMDSYQNLITVFLNDDNISQNHLFILCCEIFKYFKSSIIYKAGDKVLQLLKNLENLTTLKTIPEKNKSQITLKIQVFKFFNNLIKEAEIFYKFKENIEEIELNKFRDFFDEDFYDFNKICAETKIELEGIQKVVFIVHPDTLFLKQKDIKHFLDNAPYENFNIKLMYILKYYPSIIDVLNVRKELSRLNSRIMTYLFTLEYEKSIYFSVFLSIITNIILLLTTGVKIIVENENENDNFYDPSNSNPLTPYKKKIDKGWDWRKITPEEVIYDIAIFHIIYLLLMIINYIYFAMIKQKFLNYRYKYTTSQKLANFLAFFGHNDIAPLVWNFIMGSLATLNSNFKFVYSLQLFTIFNLVDTMQSAIYSVRVRYKQFLSAALLISIIILFYSAISFYLFRDQFFNEEIQENLCSTFLHCFLTLITNGIRAGNGLGFPMLSIRNKKYFSEFIFEWVFYFSIILIMLNVINGIIVDTFQALREQNNLKADIVANVCYICSINRSKFEIKGINYSNHINIEHDVMNYFYYILKVKLTNEQDLNSLDYQVLNSINELRTDFFPVKKALSLGSA